MGDNNSCSAGEIEDERKSPAVRDFPENHECHNEVESTTQHDRESMFSQSEYMDAMDFAIDNQFASSAIASTTAADVVTDIAFQERASQVGDDKLGNVPDKGGASGTRSREAVNSRKADEELDLSESLRVLNVDKICERYNKHRDEIWDEFTGSVLVFIAPPDVHQSHPQLAHINDLSEILNGYNQLTSLLLQKQETDLANDLSSTLTDIREREAEQGNVFKHFLGDLNVDFPTKQHNSICAPLIEILRQKLAGFFDAMRNDFMRFFSSTNL
ncbi:hypothetical protein BC832DRAFT_594623 [Gaertneriomyces semiglobifer]|nr:hypothetical protein BC832DRAFT_594623 [Gaertneriomyces semiglobifer]